MLKKTVRYILLVVLVAANILIGIKIAKQYYLSDTLTNLKVPKEYVIDITGTIYNDKYPKPIFLQGIKLLDMPSRTKQLVKMVRSGKKNILIRINSPGGVLDDGMDFVKVMRAAQTQGVRFTCVIDGQAMSMALIIFSECDTRRAVFGSKLMWHSMSQMGGLRTVNEASISSLLNFIRAKNEEIWASTRWYFWPWDFTYHFARETILTATEVERMSVFGYLRVINNLKIKKSTKKKSKR